jgi:hypothetical protein
MVVDYFLVSPMLILHMLIPPLLLYLRHLHLCHSHLLVFHHHMDLAISYLGCLDNTLVIAVKEQVDMVVKMMMKTMISSRSLHMDSRQAFVGDG